MMNILITGSSSGIGEGLAFYYLSQGNTVIDISRRGNATLARQEKFKHYSCDLSDEKELASTLNHISDNYHEINLLILNAGILGEIKAMPQHNLVDIKYLMEVNVWANKIILDALFTRKILVNRVVAISSGAAKNGSAGWGPYSISKAALNMLIKTYAAEFPNTHFCAVAPGLVDTAMQDFIFALKKNEAFPTIERLQAAKGTSAMPDAKTLAPRLDRMFQKLLAFDSGTFADIREGDWD